MCQKLNSSNGFARAKFVSTADFLGISAAVNRVVLDRSPISPKLTSSEPIGVATILPAVRRLLIASISVLS
jgi:hypothetical protein